ncbi:hypothetical protein LMG33818_000892 [Halomonadaceae bacterium LMG 33818]|uniref:hypothetical protein n=1 Tax=Cernens ardua TaxID=3402176 RepID=UPI003EDBE5EB
MAYEQQTWKDGKDGGTPITADRLNHMEAGIGATVGPQGPKGDTGPAGKDGAAGPKGDKGETGPAGKDGTTPDAGTADLLNAGTDTTLRSWSAKMIADYVASKISAANKSS